MQDKWYCDWWMNVLQTRLKQHNLEPAWEDFDRLYDDSWAMWCNAANDTEAKLYVLNQLEVFLTQREAENE
jgi:hypothetical protein